MKRVRLRLGIGWMCVAVIAGLAGCDAGGAGVGAPSSTTTTQSAVSKSGAVAASSSVSTKAGPMPVYTSLYAFSGGADGASPQAGLTLLGGELFGTTIQGGGSSACTYFNTGTGCGVVFKVSATGSESVVYPFAGGMTDGGYPTAPLLAVGGALYGTTFAYGQTSGGCCGTVFSVTPAGAEHVLYGFKGGTSDGAQGSPGGLTDVKGVLYGTTLAGGSGVSAGTVYALTFAGAETTLHSFTGLGGDSGPSLDGAFPGGGLVNVGGVLYGTTAAGGGGNPREGEGCGGDGCGTIFTITSSGGYRQIYRSQNYYGGSDADDYGGNLINVDGALYGTAAGGGAYGHGAIFAVSTAGSEHVIYSFKGGSDGAQPQPGLTAINGTLYGTTAFGGSGGCEVGGGCGTVFAVTPYGVTSSGVERVVYRFLGGTDGSYPNGNLVVLDGALYGTTLNGGKNSLGTVFAIKP